MELIEIKASEDPEFEKELESKTSQDLRFTLEELGQRFTKESIVAAKTHKRYKMAKKELNKRMKKEAV